MSSSQIMCGLPIVDIPEFKSIDQKYVLRGKDIDDMIQKIKELQLMVPVSIDGVAYPIGYRPDRLVPVARYFAEVEFRAHSVGVCEFCPWWSWTFQGKKEET